MSDRPTVTTEGRTLNDALRLAANELGVDVAQVQHKLDLSHFRNAFGGATGVDTVKIIAWTRDMTEVAGGEAARVWLAELVAKMGIEATVAMRVRENQHADLRIDSEKARFLVGKQGFTLKAIRHLLAESVGRRFPAWTYHLDVTGGDRDREDRGDRGDRGGERGERGGDRGERGGDRGDRGGRGERRDRGDRGDRRDRRDREDRGERSEADVESLKRLARKVALNVKASGERELIRKRLNSFERRVVHLAVKEVDGISSESVEVDGDKLIEVYVLDRDVVGEE